MHVHILPRRFQGDRFENTNDDIYPTIEASEKDLLHDLRTRDSRDIETVKVDADEDRKPRSLEEMEKETLWLKSFFTSA